MYERYNIGQTFFIPFSSIVFHCFNILPISRSAMHYNSKLKRSFFDKEYNECLTTSKPAACANFKPRAGFTSLF